MSERPASSLPPGPSERVRFLSLQRMVRDPMKFFVAMMRAFGGIVRIPLKKDSAIYLVTEPALLKELLVDKRSSYQKNIRYGAMQRLIGDGLLLSEGDIWRRQRRLTQPAFKAAEIDRHLEWMAQ